MVILEEIINSLEGRHPLGSVPLFRCSEMSHQLVGVCEKGPEDKNPSG